MTEDRHPTGDGSPTEFEVTFVVATDADGAWKALEGLQVGRVDGDARPRRWWLPGFESTGTEVVVEPARRLTVRKDASPCAGTLIALAFEHAGTGTRITVVQSGFEDAFLRGAGEAFWIAADQIAADLRLFFTAGVLGGRHGRPWAFLGCDATATPLGIELLAVQDGAWASRVGLVPGDVLLTLAGAPLTTLRDYVTVQRIVAPGDDLAATWARGGRHMGATAPL
jgi:hypothetical protein